MSKLDQIWLSQSLFLFQYGIAVICYRSLLRCTIGPNSVNFYPILMFKGSIWGFLGLPSPFPPIKIEFLQSCKNQMQICNHKRGKVTAKTAANKSQKKKVAKTCEEFRQCGNFSRVLRHTLAIVPYWAYAGDFVALLE